MLEGSLRFVRICYPPNLQLLILFTRIIHSQQQARTGIARENNFNIISQTGQQDEEGRKG